MANPYIAVASVTAFAISELVDWSVYTFTGYDFAKRILLSSAISTPIDSIVFLYMIGHLSITAVVIMTLSKMIGAFTVYLLINKRNNYNYI